MKNNKTTKSMLLIPVEEDDFRAIENGQENECRIDNYSVLPPAKKGFQQIKTRIKKISRDAFVLLQSYTYRNGELILSGKGLLKQLNGMPSFIFTKWLSSSEPASESIIFEFK